MVQCAPCAAACSATLGCPITAPACLLTGTLCIQCLAGVPNGIAPANPTWPPNGCGMNAGQLYQCMSELPSLTCTETEQTSRG